jgi:hypothetical protein
MDCEGLQHCERDITNKKTRYIKKTRNRAKKKEKKEHVPECGHKAFSMIALLSDVWLVECLWVEW